MSISHANNGTASSGGTNTMTPGYPATPASGDLFIEALVTKYATRTVNTPAGWTARGNTTGGAGTDGTADEGNVRVAAFSMVSAGTESGTFNQTLTGGTANMTACRVARFTRSGGTGWLIGTAGVGSDNAGGAASLSMTFDVDPGFQTGDVAVVVVGTNNDAYSHSSLALSVPGCTVGASSAAFDGGFTDGSDARLALYLFPISSGTSSGAATFTCNTSGSATNAPAGAALIIRLREDGVSDTPMDAAVGTFTLTGQAATFDVTMQAETGAFALTGNAASLEPSVGGESYHPRTDKRRRAAAVAYYLRTQGMG